MTIRFTGSAIVLDIEGTLLPIRYAGDVLGPYARRRMHRFLRANWENPAVAQAREQLARDAGAGCFIAWCGGELGGRSVEKLCVEVYRQMESGTSTVGLRRLQELLWQEGFASGDLRTPVYADVLPGLQRWRESNIDVRAYSASSAAEQRMLLAHTGDGDLTPLINGYFDGGAGSKRLPESYSAIAGEMGLPPEEILCVSDTKAELDAAHGAGCATALVVRPGNPPVRESHAHAIVSELSEIALPAHLHS
ncbi:MAG TPA: acireductone synthase [Tepidisphaeraceae bacterium]|jgi:enolase-phosphatase E1